VLSVALLVAAPAGAASLQQLAQSEWQGGVSGLPAYVNMYLYVPDRLATKPPVVVAPHHCQGNGPGTFNEMSSLVSRADQSGFILIFPEATGQNCWDAGSDRSLTHDGKGDTHAVVQMVRHVLATYDGNAARVYSVGGSSGGIMTEALLGVYPDMFMAGVSYMGVPAGCWAEGYNDVVGKPENGTGQWSGPCASGNVIKTGAEWGDLVRSFFTSHVGHRPRLQHWHGTADTTIRFANLAEDIKQWTHVLGLSETPSGTDTPSNGTTRQHWVNACGYTVYEAFSLSGVGHAVPFDGNAVATYFGLDDAEGADPEAAACPGTVPEGAGSSGLGGATGSGAATPSGGDAVNGSAAATGADDTLGTVSPPSNGEATAGGSSPSATGLPTPSAVAAPGTLGTSNGDAPAASPVAGSEGLSEPPGLNRNDEMNSGGCACSLPAHTNGSSGAAVLLAAAAGLIGLRRRGRCCSSISPSHRN
jgi:poly(hydroxyalkanoate) depolymerase family esterase